MIKIGNNNIGSIYLGSSKIGKAYLGSNLVYMTGSAPTPGETISYIRGGADGSYIDTGITADNNTRIIIWARNFNPNSIVICGSRTVGGNDLFGIFAPPVQKTGSLRFDFGSSQNHVDNAFHLLSGYHKYELNSNNFYVDDELKGTATSATFSNNLNIYLFAINNSGAAPNTASTPIDICACKIYKNGTLVRDFTAVNSTSVGLYDSVSETLFTNAGSGSFTYGTFVRNAYVPIEYIECSGSQYFDSGIRGSNSLDYVVKFRNGDAADYPDLFFAQTSASSKRYGIEFNASNSTIYFMFGSAQKSYSYSLGGKELVATKSGVNHYLYDNNVQITNQTHTSATFTTDYNIFVGCRNNAGGANHFYKGRIYYLGFNSGKNFVPAKVGGVAGMYDTYNEVFYPSESGTAFIAGPKL